MDTKEFVETLVKIDFVEQSQCYGHYPFQLYAENEKQEITLGAIMGISDVRECYRSAQHAINEGNRKVFLSTDFPGHHDMPHDHVVIFSYEDGQFSAFAIPYSVKTGKVMEAVHEGEFLDIVLEQFKQTVNSFRIKVTKS